MFSETSFIHFIRDIAIVGSGLSGLTLGHRLQSLGYNVTLFEKARGPGGRLAAKRTDDGSVDIGAQYFTIRNEQFAKFLADKAGEGACAIWNGNFQDIDSAGELRPSSRETRYVGVPRMSAISRGLSAGLDLQTGQRITGLQKGTSGQWSVSTETGVRDGYDAVLLTAPVQQCRDILAASSLASEFNDLNQTDYELEPCWAVALHFSAPLGLGSDGARLNDPVLGWAANNSSKPQRGGAGEWWVLHGSADWSARNKDLPGDDVIRLLFQAFARVTGITQLPVSSLSHRWLYAKAGSARQGSLWWPGQRLGIAGDWLCGGRVEAAWESAEHLVEQIRTSVQDKNA